MTTPFRSFSLLLLPLSDKKVCDLSTLPIHPDSYPAVGHLSFEISDLSRGARVWTLFMEWPPAPSYYPAFPLTRVSVVY